MSEEVTVKTEPEDDEENGRTTPVRKSVQEYEQAMNSVVSPSSGGVTIKQENPQSDVVRNNEYEGRATEAVDNADVAIPTNDESEKDASARSERDGTVPTTVPTFSTSDTNHKAADNEDVNVNLTATDISNGVLVKDEPQDIDMADLEKTMACFDGQSNDREDTPPPPPAPPQITSLTPPPPPPESCTTPLPSLTDTENTKQSANDLSPEVIGAMVKEELPDKEFAELQEAAEEAGIEHSDNSKETGNFVPATSPKISTVPMLRLRVKPEFSTLPQEEGVGVQPEQEFSSLPQDFFDGILTENIAARPMIRPKDEPIPDNFFDDLLVDKVQQRIEAAETQDLEVKYGDRLKQLEKLEQELAKEKRKHKKLKKKSKKRQRSPSPTSRRRASRSPSPSRRRRSHSRSPIPPRRRGSRSPSPSRRRRSHSRSPPRRRLSRSPSPSRRRRSHSRSPPPPPRRRASRSPSLSRRRNSRTRSPPPRHRGSRSHTPPEQRKQKLMRWPEKSEFDDRIEMPSTSKRKRPHGVAANMCVDDDRRVDFKQERRIVENISPIKVMGEKLPRRHAPVADVEIHDDPLNEDMQPHLPELGEEITAKQKRDRIILRAKTLMKYLKVMEMEKDKPLSTFLYTSIVRKLPASHSYRNQHIYENRSPLHNVNNVTYKFNSHARRFNLEEWGLASLPPVAANIAKLVGYDAQTIHNKLKVIKIPAKIRKIKREDGEDDDDEDEEELLQGRSSLFCNASTQTDETVDVLKRKPQGYDIGVQAVQPAFEIACQTLETESPSIKMYDNNDDLPIMGIMREMNDNQLMALHDFAELLKEPPTSAMDMYRLRQRMLDIYKCSQLPSAMSAPAAAALNSYSSKESSPSSRVRHSEQGSGIRINSVEGGDGSYFAVNDPRVNFINYRNRDMQTNTTIRHINPNDPRNPSRRPVDNSKSGQRQEQKSNAAPSNGPKYYGRGGLRR